MGLVIRIGNRKFLFLGLFFALIFLIAPIMQAEATVNMHDDVTFNSWMITDLHSYDLTTSEDRLTQVYIDLELGEGDVPPDMYLNEHDLSYDSEYEIRFQYFFSNGEGFDVDVVLSLDIFFKTPADAEWRYYDTLSDTAVVNSYDTKSGLVPIEQPLDARLSGIWAEGNEVFVRWWLSVREVTDPTNFDYEIYGTKFNVVESDDVAEDTTEDTTDDGTTGDGTSGSSTDGEEEKTLWERFLEFIAEIFDFIARKLGFGENDG